MTARSVYLPTLPPPSVLLLWLMQGPRASDPAHDTLQNDGAEALDPTRKSGKQRDKDGHREGEAPFLSPHCFRLIFLVLHA